MIKSILCNLGTAACDEAVFRDLHTAGVWGGRGWGGPAGPHSDSPGHAVQCWNVSLLVRRGSVGTSSWNCLEECFSFSNYFDPWYTQVTVLRELDSWGFTLCLSNSMAHRDILHSKVFVLPQPWSLLKGCKLNPPCVHWASAGRKQLLMSEGSASLVTRPAV